MIRIYEGKITYLTRNKNSTEWLEYNIEEIAQQIKQKDGDLKKEEKW